MENWATYREIRQQPQVWTGWADVFGPRLTALRDWVSKLDPDEIWLCGAGTSAYIGDIIAAHLGADIRRVRAISTTDFVSNPYGFIRDGQKPLIISFGRSGNSAETVGMLDILDQNMPQAARLNVTCNADSALATRTPAQASQQVIVLPPECHDAGFAMTSSFTTMLLTALLVLDDSIQPQDLRDLAVAAETLMTPLFDLAATMPPPMRVVFTGSGPLKFAAREASLKVMELAAGDIPAIWESNLGFRHGPKSFVTEGTKVFLFQSGHAYTRQYDDDLAVELQAQFGAETVVTIGSGDVDIAIPEQKHDALTGLLHVLVSQILATTWSHALGLNVDDPFKGRGTLTRVVSGVTLYLPGET